MSGKGRMLKNVKKFADFQYKIFTEKYGQQLIDIFEFPVKLVLAPLTLAFDIDGSAQRGFGVPELVSKLSYMSIFAVATLGTYDIALEMGKKAICQRNCGTCNGWQALRCTMCRGSGRVQYQVKNYTSRSGEKATAECIADAIADNRAELVHLPSAINLDAPLPSKECPTCDGMGVMDCTECKGKLQVRISADDIASLAREDAWFRNLCCTINFVMWWPSENLAGSSCTQKKEDAHCTSDNYELRAGQWQELDLPLNTSSWSKEDLKNPEKFYEMTVLLNAQRELGDKILDAQWETRWRQERLNEMLEENVRPYMQNIDGGTTLSQPIILQSPDQNQKRTRQWRWWFF